MANNSIEYHLLNGFQDSKLTISTWNDLLHKSSSNVVFLTWHWQKVWWEIFGRGKLLLIMVEKDGNPIAIAPFFSDGGMIFFIGSGGSDYLDFIGNVDEPEVLEGILLFAAEQVPNFIGFRFYHILESSQSPANLEIIANHINWKLYIENEIISPLLELKDFPQQARQSLSKKSLLRHEAWFKQNGGFTIENLNTRDEILPHLQSFFSQHISRWESTPFPSLFIEAKHRLFYQQLVEIAEEIDWLRFTRIIWQNGTIAYHFGFLFNKNFLWYKPTFDITLAKRSPGEVLIRQLLLQAIEKDVHYFDFGLGDEAFKNRFATKNRIVRTWGLYV